MVRVTGVAQTLRAMKKTTEKDADAKKEETKKDEPKKEATKEDKPAGKAETKE